MPESEVPVQRSLIVPIVYQDEVIGRLAVANKATDYNEADKDLLERIAAYLAPVLKARLQRDAHEKALSTALAAKQVLLQEVHHRVKNNLQTISSLLNLQAESLPKASQTALEDSRLRVQSMAMVHEQLYSRDDPGELDFAEYASCLTTGLLNGHRDESGKVRLRLELDPVLLGVNQAIPCGLILNELVTNSFKYAFPESHSGEVLVGLHSQESGQVTLRVADDGVGLPPGLDWRQVKSLGLRIVQILTQQLNSTLCDKPGGGADFTLTFAKR
ncbi:MAG TPA: histidine kinase dimerization/phosphoacceptor domain -containing protein [Bryobacteraceae bacterium]|nr:histidine kinase dimerization/phosphoacceptor domain -containing protein [Bryobacteraceae bacterium]